MPPKRLRLPVLSAIGALVGMMASPLPAQEPAPSVQTANAFPGWDLPAFIDRLPPMLADRLPDFEPSGALRLYVRPHFGDFIHRDYVRVPFGARDKVSENVETSAELETYITHGLGDPAGYGFSTLRLGAKCEHVLPDLGNGGLSIGANYLTPLSRPPMELTDGYRHLQPYVAATHPLPQWHALGYASVGADLFEHTALPSNFGRNELHSDSLTFSAGAAREWPRFHASLTATVTTSELITNEGKQVYSLRPEIVLPWKSRTGSATQVLFTLGGRAIHGPDGNEFGVSSSVRIEFQLNRNTGGK